MWGNSALANTKSAHANPPDSSGGFTIVELLISISVSGILMISVMAATLNYYVLITRTNIRVDMTNDSQNLLRSTVEAIRYGMGVRQSNTVTDLSQPGGWNTSDANFVIIIAVPARDASGEYIVDPLTGGPYANELVYYKSGTLLYRRTLANPLAIGNSATTTCPPAIATPSCPADTKLLEHLSTMSFILYDQDDAVTTVATSARSVRINLSSSRDTFGSPIVINNGIRVTLRNVF